MEKEIKLKETVQTVSTISPTVKVPTDQKQQKVDQKLITLKGITTSQINQALKAKNPYPARVFLKVDNQEQEIPVFFRIKDNQGNYIRPKIKKGSYLSVEGHFDNPKNGSSRKSFTATSYQLLNQEVKQEILCQTWKN